MVAPVPCALAIATSVSKQTNTCARRFAITISSVLYLTSLTGALHKNKKEAKILYCVCGGTDNRRGSLGRSHPAARNAMGARDCARRRSRSTRRRCRDRRAPPAAAAPWHPDNPRRREPAE